MLRTIAIRGYLIAAALAASALLADAASAEAVTPLRVQLPWLHQAQFAGYYFGEVNGYRSGTGEVELREGGPGIDPIELLVKGDVDVAVGWLADALRARTRGADIVNVAQIFRNPGMEIACLKRTGVRGPADLASRAVGVWNVGDEISVHLWLARAGVPEGAVRYVQQAANAADLIAGRVPCATVMLYNEYWSLVDAGFKPADLYVVRFGSAGIGMLEDGLYVRRERLEDPAFRQRVAGFLAAAAEGWKHTRDHPDEALALVLARSPSLDRAHQRRMLQNVLTLIPAEAPFGLLDLAAYRHTVDIYAHSAPDAAAIRAAAADGWTHQVWYDAGLGTGGGLTEATRYHLRVAMDSTWFYLLDLVGTASFGLAGFMRARQRRYDLWGALVLTLLPAVGGGTVRDLLIGGDRHPPFIFKDPNYMYVVFAVLVFGTVAARFVSTASTRSKGFEWFLAVFDTIGLAAFTLVGAKVALLSGLAWYWVPICAAITCAGGGMMLDVVTGHEPRTFLGEPYEDLAVVGGSSLYVALLVANRYEHSPWIVTVAIVLTFVGVYAARIAVIAYGVRSYRLGDAVRRVREARRRER